MFLVIGIDGLAPQVVLENWNSLPTFQILFSRNHVATHYRLKDEPISAALWCSMFTGTTPDEHGHRMYHNYTRPYTREDIKQPFIWDQVPSAKAINVPFVVPPYSYGVSFQPAGFGLPDNPTEWREEIERVTETVRAEMTARPPLLVAVFTVLDRLQHYHWNEREILQAWYLAIDIALKRILLETDFMDERGGVLKNHKLLVVSDHGFASWGEPETQTLPRTVHTPAGTFEIKGDHDNKALALSWNVTTPVTDTTDVYRAISKQV